MSAAGRTRVLLIGAHGYGVAHLENLARLTGRVELVGTVDPSGPSDHATASGVAHWTTLAPALAAASPDLVIIATPTGTHYPLAVECLRAGADLYLEKPPVATMEQFESLLSLQRETGSTIQVGFQSLGSHALGTLASLGPATSVAAWGLWVRTARYWKRSAWAGRRELDGAPVVDGVVTNPLSHAVATALRLAGARRRADVARVETELLRANDIEADDTSAVRVTLSDGRTVSLALTLCAAENQPPVVEVRTRDTDARFSYTEDILTTNGEARRFGRDDLFENLLDAIDHGAPLISSLEDCGAFMEVLEAVRTAPEPTRIDARHVSVRGTGDDARPIVDDIEWWIERAAGAGALFSELRTPWSPPRVRGASSALIIGSGDTGDGLIVREDGSDVACTSSPRPYLHPIRTRRGVTVSDAHPLDHDWHLGLSFGFQHVNGVNFWGGRTYTSDQGYRWLADHGRVATRRLTERRGRDEGHDGFVSESEWRTPHDEVVFDETLWARVEKVSSPEAWRMELDWTLRAATDVVIGSPGTHGRRRAGYGGLSWRLPQAEDVTLLTADASGEDAVHGSVSSWLAARGTFPGGAATIVVTQPDDASRDRWFVRLAAFPAIGTAPAWDEEIVLTAGEQLRRRYVVSVADGLLDEAEIRELTERNR